MQNIIKTSYRPDELIQIYANNVLGMFQENTKCAFDACKIKKRNMRVMYLKYRFGGTKIDESLREDKTYLRLSKIGDLEDDTLDNALRDAGVVEAPSPKYNIDALKDHINGGCGSSIVMLDADGKKYEKPSEKIYVESLMTARLNNDGVVFREMVVVLKMIIDIVRSSPFGTYLESGQIACLMKGGMASRHILINTYGRPTSEVDSIYGNGDCDFGFIVDSRLEGASDLCASLNDLIYDTLRAIELHHFRETVNKINSITDLNICGNTISCSPLRTRNFRKTKICGSDYLDYDEGKRVIRATTNYICDLGFNFHLSRLKASFKLLDEGLGIDGYTSAEVLDISTQVYDFSKLNGTLLIFN